MQCSISSRSLQKGAFSSPDIVVAGIEVGKASTFHHLKDFCSELAIIHHRQQHMYSHHNQAVG
jgi:hypothetical protein